MARVLKVRVKDHGKGLECGGHHKGARRKSLVIFELTILNDFFSCILVVVVDI